MLAVEEDSREHSVGTVNPGFSHEDPSKKLSPPPAINVFEERQRKLSPASVMYEERMRKISSGSRDFRRKSVLPNGERIHQLDTVNTRPPQHLNLDHLHATKPNESWWYLLCSKCRQKESGPGWEPGFWQSVCPYPFCPTYRHVARCLSLVLVILLAWGVVCSVVGEDAEPGGQLFTIAFLVISAHFAGYLFRMCNLPGLVGMLLVGILYQNAGLLHIQGHYLHFCSILRKIALVIILTRAGLDLDPGAMKKLFATILKLGLVPWVFEAGFVALMTHYFLQMPWLWGFLTGSIVAAVSPAVIVPGLMRLRGKGYGVAKGIPTIVIAISGIDDAASVAAFGIFQSIMFSENSLAYNIALGPGSIVLGLGSGILWGVLSKYIPEKGDPFVVPMRILMLLGGGMIAVFGSEAVGLEGAGPLGVVAAAFVSAWLWSTQGWDVEDNPAATAFEIFWMVFEPILFSLTGTQIRVAEINPHVFTTAFLGLLIAFVLRIVLTVLISFRTSLNIKEKLFIAFSCMSKASVQAALAPVALDTVMRLGKGDGPERDYAEHALMICVLCIIMTAPTGAIIIYFSGPRLLTKTAPGPSPQMQHRGHRPSMRDITVIDEGNETCDLERRMSRDMERRVSRDMSRRVSRSSSVVPTPRPSVVNPPNPSTLQHP